MLTSVWWSQLLYHESNVLTQDIQLFLTLVVRVVSTKVIQVLKEQTHSATQNDSMSHQFRKAVLRYVPFHISGLHCTCKVLTEKLQI